MDEKPTVLLIVTQDTKYEEGQFLRSALEARGVEVVLLDPSVRKSVGGAEISPEMIAEAAGTTIEAVRALGHEGKCQAVMIDGALKLALEALKVRGISGILGIGGSMGTTLGTAIMRAFPYGVPKLMISTMASGFTAPWVGLKDICMLNAVCDISGLNSISREVYLNGANAVAGMAHGYKQDTGPQKPLVLVSTLGTTEQCMQRLRRQLEADGFEVMVFHSSGAGGQTLDAIAAEREVAAVVDMSLVELIDLLNGGLCSAGPDRARAAPRRGIPTIFAPGNIDFIVAGPLEQAEQQFPGTRYHVHNAALTAVRTQEPQLKALAEHVAGIAAEARGPIRFFLPLKGFSHHDSPQGHIHEPSLPPKFADHVEKVMPASVEVKRFDCHINDAEFADALADAVREMTAGRMSHE